MLLPSLKVDGPPGYTGCLKPHHSKVIHTTNEPVAVLPAASVELQVTVVRPGAELLPDARSQVTAVSRLTRSCALAVQLAGPPAPLVADAPMWAGSVSAGGVVCWTRTGREPLAVLPAASLAVHVMV